MHVHCSHSVLRRFLPLETYESHFRPKLCTEVEVLSYIMGRVTDGSIFETNDPIDNHVIQQDEDR